jgi:hypothetical protein
MSYFEPWTKYPCLTRERLSIVANIIREARHGAVLRFQPEYGENLWCLGCTNYSRTCSAITTATHEYDWLRILPEPKLLAFSFTIGTVSFRFYKGKPDDPPDRYLISTFGELHHQQLCLEIDGLRPLDKILRLAVETDDTLEVSDVTCVELDEAGNPTGEYVIPRGAEPSNVTPIQPKPKDIPPPSLEPIKEEEDKEKKKADGNPGS